MIQPKEITVKTGEGEKREYIISKFPAIAGREIIAKYPVSAMPKLGDYDVNEATMLKLMGYVAVKIDGGDPVMLSTKSLVDNHVPDWEALARIEIEIMGYNCSFFRDGKISNFFDIIKANAKQLISSTLTDSLAPLFQRNKQPSKS